MREGALTAMVRILIADDHEIVRAGLQNILEAQPGWEVVAVAGDGREAIQKAAVMLPSSTTRCLSSME